MDTAKLHTLQGATRYGPPVANLVLIVLIAIALARLLWLVVPSPGGSWQTPPQAEQSVSDKQKAQGPDLAAIKKSHLFGVPPAQSGAEKSAPVNAPETHLNLTLDGILAWSHPKLSRALIRGPDNKEQHYAVGDEIPGKAEISAIYSSRVILKRDGGYETLRMEQEQMPLKTAGNASQAGSLGEAVRNKNYGAVRTKLLKHPNKITQVMRLQPAYENGQLQGYRVYPGSKRRIFRALGLQPGDLIKAVNGTTLNNQQAGLALLGKLKNARQLNVTINRHGRTQRLTLSLQ